MSKLFSDLKVIDGASFLAGPCAATILSDFGAEVIKVEPFSGDRHRSIAAGHPSEYSWQLTDRNRRGIALDITRPEGYRTLLEMLRQADVFVVNFSPAQLTKHQLEWDRLHALNPRLIVAHVSAYGQAGPDAERRAFDLTGWYARTGILDMMRDKDLPPSMPPGGVGDHATAMTLFAGIMMALYKRDRSGEGSLVSTSLAATGAWANGLNLQAVMAGVDATVRRDEEGWSNPLQNVYTSADDRYLLIALQNVQRDWPGFARALDRSDWFEDERLVPVKPLFRNRVYARQQIAATFRRFPAEELCRRLDAAGIVHSLIARNAEVIEDPQLIANGLVVPYDSGVPGVERTLSTPIAISGETQRTPSRAPDVGEHSADVLRSFGFDEAAIAALIDAGVVSTADTGNRPGRSG